MKLLHISDLHLGKKINDFSMIDDQKFILQKIEDIAEREAPDAILIAGDVYDRSVPSIEAIELLEAFLCHLADKGNQIYIASGNHDSAERLAFGRTLMEDSGVHIAPAYSGEAPKYTLTDEYGQVNLYLMPFIKPAVVRHALKDDDIDTYAKAMAAAIDKMEVNPDARNVLVAHQFVTGADRCESEDMMIGGLDNIDADVFEAFDYTALGHLHAPQSLGPNNNIRYCGTPLKYSFSEVHHQKSVTIAELGAKADGKCDLTIREIRLKPMRDWADIRGTFEEVTSEEFLKTVDTEAYVRVTLLDEDDIPDAITRLRSSYPNLMNLRYDNKRTRTETDVMDAAELKQRSELELFEELFEKQNNASMSEAQRQIAGRIIETIKEEMA
ncbi:MAG: exonuclease SbcCD subunit D [Bacillota bacterium]|nr:exonuclease SbcCD subunit D [Bacillota bacterium]